MLNYFHCVFILVDFETGFMILNLFKDEDSKWSCYLCEGDGSK